MHENGVPVVAAERRAAEQAASGKTGGLHGRGAVLASLLAKETAMAQVIIRNLDAAVVALLKVRAAIHGKSLEQELRDVVAAAARPDRDDLLATVDRIRAMTPAGKHTDSVELLRKDRGR
ncbi:MAG TPA: hypothetical protein VK348_15025 [Planctomycetota bacterium]|nr:hypothetical protein [Planctomycetota bacterium]